MAAADLQLESIQGGDTEDASDPPQLLPDPAHTDRWYLIYRHNAFALFAPWAPRLAHKLTSGTWLAELLFSVTDLY